MVLFSVHPGPTLGRSALEFRATIPRRSYILKLHSDSGLAESPEEYPWYSAAPGKSPAAGRKA